MIKKTIEEAFTPEWVTDNISDPADELVILRKIIPWETVINGLTRFYSDREGRPGITLRTAAALLIIQKFRGFSGREVPGSPKFRPAAAAGSPLPFFAVYICLSGILLFRFFRKRQQRSESGFCETCQRENYGGSVFYVFIQ